MSQEVVNFKVDNLHPSLTGSCRFEEQACHVMEGCQDNVKTEAVEAFNEVIIFILY